MLLKRLLLTAAIVGVPAVTQAATVPLTFTKLTGITGGAIQGTAVYRADLSALTGTIASITVEDVSGGFGGATGQFSGFDLDAVILSTDLIGAAGDVGTLTPAATLLYTAAVFAPGTQRAPIDPKLFGTNAAGTAVDNPVATLGAFDGESTTAIPGADGFVSLGDFGKLSINLSAALALGGPLYLYIGEVGDNGEVAGSNVSISDQPVGVPEPAGLLLLGAGLAGLGLARRRR
jgi:hypothetical protein